MPDPLADLARLEGVPSAVQAARDAVDAVLRDRGIRRVGPEARARARWASVQATAELAVAEGGGAAAPRPEDQSDEPDDEPVEHRGHAKEPAGPDVGLEQYRAGAVRLYSELDELAGSIRRSPPQVLARAHALLGRDLLEDDVLGRVIEPAAVARMAGLTELLIGATAAPVPVLAAVAHAEIATARPFGFADGVIARAVERMILVDGGVDPPGMIITEAGHRRAGPAYPRLLTGYATGQAAGVRDWLLHVAGAIAYGAEVSPVAPRR